MFCGHQYPTIPNVKGGGGSRVKRWGVKALYRKAGISEGEWSFRLYVLCTFVSTLSPEISIVRLLYVPRLLLSDVPSGLPSGLPDTPLALVHARFC